MLDDTLTILIHIDRAGARMRAGAMIALVGMLNDPAFREPA